MTNETKRNLFMVGLSASVILMTVVAHIQTDRRAFITKTTQNVTLEAKPIAEPTGTLVLLDEMVITAEDEKPSVGAAMARKPKKLVSKPARQGKTETCHLHRLEQGGSVEHPFVTVCE